MPDNTFVSFDMVFHSLIFLSSTQVQAGSGAHPDLRSIGLGFFPVSRAAGMWYWQLTSI